MVLGAQAPGRVGRRPVFAQDRKPASAGFRSRSRPSWALEGVRFRGREVGRASPAARAVPRLRRMELRDGDLVLRPWTEDDVPALVAGCNDPEIARWIPIIPSPYTEDGRAGVRPRRGARRTEHAFAITLDGAVVGGDRDERRRVTATGHDRLLGARRLRAARASAPARLRLCRASRLDELELRAARAVHRSRQRRVAARRREGRIPARGRPSRAPPPPGRPHPRLGDVLAATRRASRLTTAPRPFEPAPSSRSRRTRDSSGGCVLNMRAMPSLSNGSIG